MVEKLAGAAQKFVDFSEAGAELVLFELKQTLPSLARVALGREVGGLLFESEVFGFALQLFSGGRIDLRGEIMKALTHFAEQRVDASERSSRRAMALFQPRDPGHAL